jgi:hypothetical protein
MSRVYGSKSSLNDIACLYIHKNHKLVGLLAVDIICASKEKKTETMYVCTRTCENEEIKDGS